MQKDFQFFQTICDAYYPIGFLLPQNNFLDSAWNVLHGKLEGAKPESMERIKLKKQKYIDKLFMDSGMLSALVNGKKEWMHNQPYIVEQLDKTGADIISHVDIPMSPKLLVPNNITGEQALEQTIKNAAQMLEIKTTAKKCFVVQGWTKEQYMRCIAAYKDMGIFNGEHWCGVGSIIVRAPPNLFTVAAHCINEIRAINPEQHIHAFGISQYETLAELTRLGISSGDSAALMIRTIQGDMLLGNQKTVNIAIKPGTVKLYSAIYVVNAWSWWTSYQGLLNGKKTSLHSFMQSAVETAQTGVVALDTPLIESEQQIPFTLEG